jgi:ComF family protein
MWKVDQILALFAPFECLSCGHEGSLLCHSCGLTALPASPKRCYRCLQPTSTALCPACQTKTELDAVQVAVEYKGVAVQLVARLKFSRTQAAAPLIARVMARNLSPSPVDTVVVHIPTANRRVRERGYDQAQLIAREFARCRRLPCQTLLRRCGSTRQVGANREQRTVQLASAFYCPNPNRVRGKRIVVVDDVLTTGATVEAATRVLRQAGAAEVKAVLFAQKL